MRDFYGWDRCDWGKALFRRNLGGQVQNAKIVLLNWSLPLWKTVFWFYNVGQRNSKDSYGASQPARRFWGFEQGQDNHGNKSVYAIFTFIISFLNTQWFCVLLQSWCFGPCTSPAWTIRPEGNEQFLTENEWTWWPWPFNQVEISLPNEQVFSTIMIWVKGKFYLFWPPRNHGQGRLEVLKIHAAPITKHGDIDYEAICKLADGFNAADLRNVCTEAVSLFFCFDTVRFPCLKNCSGDVCNSGREGLCNRGRFYEGSS